MAEAGEAARPLTLNDHNDCKHDKEIVRVRHKVGSTLVVVALGLALVGCGSSDDDDASSGAAATTAAKRAAPTTVADDASASESDATADDATSGDDSATTEAAGSGSSKGELPDPCTLVTKDDAVALAGTDLEDGISAGTPDDMSCTYTGDPNGPTAQVEFYVGDGSKKYYDIDQSLDHEFTDVPGVGDEAHLEEFAIFFRVGERWNVIRLTRLDDFEPYRQPMIDLATKVAALG